MALGGHRAALAAHKRGGSGGVLEQIVRQGKRRLEQFPASPCAVFGQSWGSLKDAVSLGKQVLEGGEFSAA